MGTERSRLRRRSSPRATARCSRLGRALAALVLAAPTVAPAQTFTDPDGNDEPAPDPGPGLDRAQGIFVAVGRAPLAHPHVCDLTAFADALFIAYARRPLGSDGATLGRYQPDPTNARARAFSVAFDWNRPGQPTNGGGAGQGFLRVRALGDVLALPDADPPYAGFGLRDGGTEGYVFLSDHEGRFAPARGPRLRPPAPPAPDGTRAGAAVVPRAYHVLDVIAYRGRWYTSTGSVPPRERAWTGPAPGALHLATDTRARFDYAVDYPRPYAPGVFRLTFLTRFRDRLYAGLQDYDGRGPHDYVVFAPDAGATVLTQAHLRPARVTTQGAALTLRWFTDSGRLFWIALERDGSTRLRVTDDGDHWHEVALPPGVGRPTDLARFHGALVALTEGGLVRIDGTGTALTGTLIAPAPRTQRGTSHFTLDDAFCAAPLAVYRRALYAGSQRDGSLFRLDLAPAP